MIKFSLFMWQIQRFIIFKLICNYHIEPSSHIPQKKSVPYKQEILHMVQIRACSISNQNKSVPYEQQISYIVQIQACSISNQNKSVPYEQEISYMVQI